MQYYSNSKSANRLSRLGFGCMRFPRNISQIDASKTEALILRAIQLGVNYFDTAYLYGGSEEMLGKIINKNNIRDKIYIATKLPVIKCTKYEDLDAFFDEQLNRLGTDYIDYYLLHNMAGVDMWKKLQALGIEDWIKTKKESGQIKQIGFSFHGAQAQFMALLDEYEWDFCQIQYNYINTNYQAGTAGLKRAAGKGLAVIIMEPLLGGALANNLPKKAKKVFENADSTKTPAEWALRWLWNKPEVSVVLSGMNSMPQLEENAKTAESAAHNSLTKDEQETYSAAIDAFNESYKVPCTGCEYCMPCPHDVNIPGCFAAYNMSYATGRVSGIMQYFTATRVGDRNKNHAASRCQKCGKCEKQCPQHIEIISKLKNVRKRMEPFWLKPIAAIAMKQMQIKKETETAE